MADNEVRVKLVIDADSEKAVSDIKKSLSEVEKQTASKDNKSKNAKADLHKQFLEMDRKREAEKLANEKQQLAMAKQRADAIKLAEEKAKKENEERQKVLDRVKAEKNAASGAAFSVGKFVAAAHAAAFTAGTAFVTAAAASAFQRMELVKRMTMQTVSLSGNKNVDFRQAHDMASIYEREFRKIGIASGASSEQVNRAFSSVASGITNRRIARLTASDAENITKDMAKVSAVIPGGMDSLVESYDRLKEGNINSQDSMVQLITTMGVLKGTAPQVARQMAYMMPEKRMELAEKAMKEMAKKTGGLTGFAGFEASMSAVGKSALMDIGEPIVNQLLPMLEATKSYFVSHGDEIAAVATKIGKYFSKFIGGSGEILQSFYDAFTQDTDGMGSSIQRAADYFKNAFQWVYDNREAIAKTFKDVFDVFLKVADYFKEAADSVSDNFMRGKNELSAQQTRDYEKAKELAAQGKREEAQQLFDQVKAQMIAEKTSGESQVKMIGGQAVVTEGKSVAAFDEQAIAARVNSFAQVMDESAKHFAAIDTASAHQNIDEFIKAYNAAKKANDEAVLNQAASVLSNSFILQDALLRSGKDIEGGFAGMVESLRNGLPADFLKTLAGKARDSVMGDKKLGPQVNFNGNTWNIKQDFRDQDPERVALMFKSDIMSAASSRTQAMRSNMPYA